MLKNLLETKQGKYMFLFVVLLLLLISGALIAVFSGGRAEAPVVESTEESISKEEQQKTSRGAVYAGMWYSDREDEMVVELRKDGTFRASTWLSHGKYQFNDSQQIVLQDDSLGEISFNLQTKLGRTIMYTIFEEEEIVLYPDKDFMEKILEEIDHQDTVTENLVYQKWSDVLKQEQWERQSSDIKYTLTFFDDKFVQQKIVGDEEPEVHEVNFVIVSQEVEKDSCLFVITMIGDTNQDVQFRITANELVYELTSTPGSFLWQSRFEKSVDSVELTQDGAQKIDAERIDLDDE